MNWLHFIIWLAGLYMSYYLAVLLLDIAAGKHAPADGAFSNELTFSEHSAPVQLAPENAGSKDKDAKTRLDETVIKPQLEPEMIGSGGVIIDNLFKLCKQEAIIYTRSVSF